MNSQKKHFLAGCSFTDPVWQTVIPWSVLHSRQRSCYISAKAGMGIKGICTEAVYWLDLVKDDVDTMIIILPTLWRYDIEVDTETYLCNCIVDLLSCDSYGSQLAQSSDRKWIVSGGLHFDKSTEMAQAFDFLYRHQGFLVMAKEHFRALKCLIDYCKCHNIRYIVSAIQDPLDQLVGLDYIRSHVVSLLDSVGYQDWLRFDGYFIDKFLGHCRHPDDREHEILSEYIENWLSQGKNESEQKMQKSKGPVPECRKEIYHEKTAQG